MIGLGVGIDYSLFILTRHRAGLAPRAHGLDAAGRAIATSGQAVLVAGTTVVIAILGLAVAGVPALTFMGLGVRDRRRGHGRRRAHAAARAARLRGPQHRPAAACPGMTPKHEGGAYDDDGKLHGWGRWGHHVASHPWPLSRRQPRGPARCSRRPFLQMRLGRARRVERPDEQHAAPRYDLLAEGFGAGLNGPLLLAVDLSKVPPADAQAAADKVAVAVAAAPNVAVGDAAGHERRRRTRR